MTPRPLLAFAIAAFIGSTAVTDTSSAAKVVDLTEMRAILKTARLVAADSLDKGKILNPEQKLSIKNLVSNANTVWITCLRLSPESRAHTGSRDAQAVDAIMHACNDDRTELIKWLRLGARAFGESLSDSQISNLMAELDAINRSYVATDYKDKVR